MIALYKIIQVFNDPASAFETFSDHLLKTMTKLTQTCTSCKGTDTEGNAKPTCDTPFFNAKCMLGLALIARLFVFLLGPLVGLGIRSGVFGKARQAAEAAAQKFKEAFNKLPEGERARIDKDADETREELEETAKSEGRELTPEEVLEIENVKLEAIHNYKDGGSIRDAAERAQTEAINEFKKAHGIPISDGGEGEEGREGGEGDGDGDVDGDGDGVDGGEVHPI